MLKPFLKRSFKLLGSLLWMLFLGVKPVDSIVIEKTKEEKSNVLNIECKMYYGY